MLLLGPIDFLILRIKLFIPAQYGIKKWNWQYVERRRNEVPFGIHPQSGSVRTADTSLRDLSSKWIRNSYFIIGTLNYVIGNPSDLFLLRNAYFIISTV